MMHRYVCPDSLPRLSAAGRRIALVFFTIALLLHILLPSPAMAQREIDGVVRAGSFDNRFTIQVNNPGTQTPVGGLSLNIAEGAKWITNIRIDADNSGILAPGASRKYTITFDVEEAAESDAIETVTFKVSADIGLIDSPNPKMTVKIKKAVKGAKEDENRKAPPVLKLVKIEGPQPGQFDLLDSGDYVVSYTEGETGFSVATKSRYRPDYIQALRVTSAPLEINLGKPFEIAAEIKKRKIHEDGKMCFPIQDGSILYPGNIGYKKERDRTLQSPKMRMEPGNAEVIGLDDLHVYCRSNDTKVPEGRVVDALVEKDGSVSMRIVFTPEKTETGQGVLRTTGKYHYRLDFVTDGKLKGAVGMSEVIKEHVINFNKSTSERGFLNPEEPRSSIAFSPFIVRSSFGYTPDISGIASITLYYDAIREGDPHITSLPKYPWPPELMRPPRDESGRVEEPGDEPGDEPGGDSRVKKSGGGSGPGGDTEVSIDPNTLDPREEDISRLIRAWISVAEPPENAAEGAKLRYDRWGRKTGATADGGIITATSRPENALAGPEETVWSVRQKLDSVNHCTVEEYVIGKLKNHSLENCRGRYKAPEAVAVAKLTGLPLSDAKINLDQAGLKARLIAGRAALSMADEGKIASQDPAPGAKVKRGAIVTLEIYGPFRREVLVPDIAGLSAGDAKAQIETQGLKARLVALGPAPSDVLSFKVKEAEPKAGSKVVPGTEVTVKVYGKYSLPHVSVPGVEGMSFPDAKARLTSAGLKVSPLSAGPAPSEEKSSRVRSQEPGAGGKVAPGSEVKVYVFSKHVPQDRTVMEPPQEQSSNCSQAAGVWQWHNGWTVHACAEKNLLVARQGNRIRSAGRWGCSERNGRAQVSLYWPPEKGQKGLLREDLTISGNRLTGKDTRGSSVRGVKTDAVPDCRGPVDSRHSDCDLGGRFENNSMALEFTTGDGINYEGRLLRVDDFWWKSGYRPGMVYFKVTRIGPNDAGGSDYTGQGMRLSKTSQGQFITKWDKVGLLRASCRGIAYTDEDARQFLTTLQRVR